MPTLLDGAMGTELARRGVNMKLPLWSAHALLQSPATVREIHRDHLDAGAEIVTTNTFRTHRRSLDKGGVGDQARELTQLAVALAQEAIEESGKSAQIAGSVSPLEDCYHPELSPGAVHEEFEEICDNLLSAGCDFLLLETVNNLAEMQSAVCAAQRSGGRFWVSVCPSALRPDSILSGERIVEALAIAEGEGAEAFLVNCAAIPVIEEAVTFIAEKAKLPYGAYANNGTVDGGSGWRFDREVGTQVFSEHAMRLVKIGCSIIGGCCGTTPDHIAAIAKELHKTTANS